MTHEQPLVGGMDPRHAPVRVGDTVRRRAGSSRTAVRELLLHLESVGFDGAPRHLGTDDQGREILTWNDGDVPLPPYPAWAMTDRALADLGGLIRRLHQGTATFRGTGADWSTEWADPGAGPVICHNDLYPENVVFRDGRVAALIDFAMAAPGRPLWDIAIAAEIWWIRDWADAGGDERAARRAELWPDVHVEHLGVHESGETFAEVTEGNPWPIGYVWERLRYDWSEPGWVKGRRHRPISSNPGAPGRSGRHPRMAVAGSR